MLNRIFTFYAGVLLLCITVRLGAQTGEWRIVGAPEGQKIFGLAQVDGTVFARSRPADGDGWTLNNFSHTSTDGGTQWNETTIAFPSGETRFVDPLFAVGNKIYAHCDQSIYWSDDKGSTWNAMDGPAGYSTVYSDLYWSGTVLSTGNFIADLQTNTWTRAASYSVGIHQLSRFGRVGQRISAVSSREGIFYSDDNCSSWTPSDFGPECVSLYTQDDLVYAVAGDSSGLYLSEDSGKTFINIDTDIRGGFLREVEGQLYSIDSRRNSIFRISDKGTDITALSTGIWREIQDLEKSGDYLLAATDCGVFRSADGGNAWYAANKGLGYQTITRMCAASYEGDTLYSVTSHGVWRSLSKGERWINIGMAGQEMYDVLAFNGKVYVTGKDRICITEDQGETWQEIETSTGSYCGSYPTLLVFKNQVYFNDTTTISLIADLSLQQKATESGRCWVAGDHIYSSKGKRTDDLITWQNLSGIANPEKVTAGFITTPSFVYAAMMNGRFEPVNDEAYRSADGVLFEGFDGGLRRTVGSGGSCWLSSICARGDTVFALEEDGGTHLPQIKFTNSNSPRWNNFTNILDKTGIGYRTPMVATEQSIHFGAYRYDFEVVQPPPEDVDEIEYIDPVPVIKADKGVKNPACFEILKKAGSYIIEIGTEGTYEITIFNSRGQMVRKAEKVHVTKEVFRWNLPVEHLSAGIYLIRAKTLKVNFNGKLAIDK